MTIHLNTSEISAKPFFFIIGRPRSGTTMLRFLFDAHPDVCIPFEGGVVWDMIVPFSRINQWNDISINTLVDKLLKIPKVELWGIDIISLKKALNDLKSKPDYQVFVKIIYHHFKSEYPKNTPKIYGDKNPIYSELPEPLLKVIPDSKLVFIIRDPRDHILSMRKAGLGKNNTIRMAILWRETMKDMIKIKTQKPESVFIIKYEELVEEPEKIMTNCFEFLGINYFTSVLDFYLEKKSHLKRFGIERPGLLHPNLFQPIKAGRSNRWKTEMEKTDLAVIDFIVKKYATSLGYELSGFKITFARKAKIIFRIMFTKILIERRHQKIMSQLKSQSE